MEMLVFILNAAEVMVFIYFAFAAVYLYVFGLAGLFPIRRTRLEKRPVSPRNYAVLIPGYKEDNVIVDVARRALQQTYPQACYDVVIIADSFQPDTINELKGLPIRLIEVSFEKSTKAKALNRAMEVLGDDYDVALVLDADNVMEEDFIERIDRSFNRGFQVVQGHRIAKNLNTPMAVLDGLSEEINNHFFRKGHRVAGLSSALIGSGMAFDYALFKHRLRNIHAVGGFDKELELTMLRDGIRIDYVPEARVYDEKVQKAEVFQNQRKRWLSAQFVYFGRFAMSGVRELFLKGNIDFLDKVYQMVSPPRVLHLGVVFLISLTYLGLHFLWPENLLYVDARYWAGTAVLSVLAFLFATPRSYYSLRTLKAMLTLPRAFGIMFLSLFRLKGANKRFIHTEHGTPNKDTVNT